MFVKTLEGLRAQGAEKVLLEGQVRSARFLTQDDGMGFTLSEVRLAAGFEATLWYKHHWEANYLVAGRARVRDLTSGEAWEIGPGSLYAVGPEDRHQVTALEDCRCVTVFNPPLSGRETHDEDGSYSPSGPVPPRRARMFVKSLGALREAGREKVVAGGSARSVRMLLQEDGIGVTLADVRLAAGNKNVLWYKHHWEANYVLAGRGQVSDLTTGEAWTMEPGMLYCVGPKDRHAMAAESDLHLVSVFCPALRGDEMHDAEGTLAPSGPVPPGPG